MKRLFFGGVHPPYRKEMSTASAALPIVQPKQVVIPLRQHIGAPCTPLVAPGDSVLRGQKIGDGDGLCVPIHASVSGTVIAIEARPHPGGGMADAIVVENDYRNTALPFSPLSNPLEELDTDAILHAIREAGIVGMGGAAFPGNAKALSALGNVDTLIANACECEPYITADDLLLRTNPTMVFEGMMLLRHVLKPERAVLAIEDNKMAAINALRALSDRYPSIEIVVLPTRYPQGAEKQLIQSVTGRQVPPGALPAQVGCTVFNVSTFAAMYRAVREGMPLIQRIVTVTGEGVSAPQNLLVPIGTPFADCIDAAGGLKDEADRVISGGPMMGAAQPDAAVPVIKATNSILCLTADPGIRVENPVCVRCGKCLSVCPMHLQPLYIHRFVHADRVKELLRLHVSDCMECGCCSFICPGRLPLVDACRQGKKRLKEVAAK